MPLIGAVQATRSTGGLAFLQNGIKPTGQKISQRRAGGEGDYPSGDAPQKLLFANAAVRRDGSAGGHGGGFCVGGGGGNACQAQKKQGQPGCYIRGQSGGGRQGSQVISHRIRHPPTAAQGAKSHRAGGTAYDGGMIGGHARQGEKNAEFGQILYSMEQGGGGGREDF